MKSGYKGLVKIYFIEECRIYFSLALKAIA